MTKVNLQLEDGDLSVEEWDELPNYIRITYEEGEDIFDQLPYMSKSQWEKLKKAGDFVFENMGDD